MKQIDVLIIDDEIKFADMLAKRLTLRGVACDVCYDGKSGTDWIRNDPQAACLVLLDLHLPDIYGTHVLEEIKNINPEQPVVIVTGHGSEKDRQECMRLGAQDFANKPISIDMIVDYLDAQKGGA